MKLANLGGRLSLIVGSGAIDVELASDGRLPSDPAAAFGVWSELRDWAAGRTDAYDGFEETSLLAPVPRPSQVFGVGLNYRAHAAETSLAVPTFPTVFAKFPTCITGPDARVRLPTQKVDWEVELVVVIAFGGRHIDETAAWRHVAGLTVGQDISEREIMLEDAALPQLSLGKSHAGFGPIGPWLVTPDEFSDPDDLAIVCYVNDDEVQSARTSELIFGVSELIARLSSIVMLLPGDLIFTGTPAGVGVSRDPQWFLRPGDTLHSTIEGIGTLRTVLT